MKNHRRPACIIHAGMLKTGTTSIQTSLFYGLRSERFRLLTLDAFSGNRLIGSAFSEDYGSGDRFISQGVTPRMAAAVPRRSRDYLDRSLAAAARRDCIPILSAEIIGMLSRSAVERLRTFVCERGWEPQVIIYARAPLDLLESMFQQRVRAGSITSRIPPRLADFIDYHVRIGYTGPLDVVDEVFGRGNVTIHWFDPARFPERCVVRHFCGGIGLPFPAAAVMRENESFGIDAVRFLYALVCAGHRRRPGLIGRLHRAVLLDRLGELRGPPTRLHPCVTTPYAAAIERDWARVEDRLGRPLPPSLHPRDDDSGVRSEADLLDFNVESLDWLAAATGRRCIRRGQGDDTVRAVVEQLEALGGRPSARSTRRVVVAHAWECFHRVRMRSRNLR